MLFRSIEHHNCMVMLYACAGHFDKALKVIEKVAASDRLKLLLPFLGACQKWVNVELGRWTFEQLVKLDEKCVVAYVCMENIYAAAGMQREADRIEALMVYGGLSNWIGC